MQRNSLSSNAMIEGFGNVSLEDTSAATIEACQGQSLCAFDICVRCADRRMDPEHVYVFACTSEQLITAEAVSQRAR